MPGEIKIEKPILRKPEKAATKIEKPLNLENKSELILPSIEEVSEVPLPLEKTGEANIIASTQVQTGQKKRALAIDNILSEGLNEMFLKMDPAQQANFKKSGEETVTKINKLLMATKVKVGKIMDLIRKWLSLIKGINKFFLEQEVKLKADKIMRLKDK